MAFCEIGNVYIIPTNLAKPPKSKFALCVCTNNNLFVWINTDKRSHGKDQLPLKAGCHELIRHDSYLDLSRLVAHQHHELKNAQKFSCISQGLCTDIIKFIEDGLELMTKKSSDIVLNNLRGLSP